MASATVLYVASWNMTIYKSCDNGKTSLISCYALSFIADCTLDGEIFPNLDDALHSSAWHRRRQEGCRKATQTNVEESERDAEQGNSEQENDSDQPRQSKELKTYVFGLGLKSQSRTRTPD